MPHTVADMGKRDSNQPGKPSKPTDQRKGDRHRPRKMVAIRGLFHDPAAVLMRRLGIVDLTELVNMALREKLEREQLWPWPPPDQAGK